jgi:hypothetical protein
MIQDKKALRRLWEEIEAELTAASREVGGDPSANYYLELNEFELAYDKLRRFRGGSEKFAAHMKYAARLMELE